MPAAGFPDSTCADELNDTPDGSLPDSVTDGAGDPDAVTMKVLLIPTENVVPSLEVMAGGADLGLSLVVMLTPFA